MQIKASPLVEAAIPKETGDRPVQIKPICLLMAYLCGLNSQPQLDGDTQLREDLESILRALPSYVDILISESITLINEYKLRQTFKRLSC